MRWSSATEPGTPGVPNEDFAAVAAPLDGGGGALVLLDGVTGRPGGDGCRHGVAWYATRLGGALVELCATRPEWELSACLAHAIGRTADAHRATCDLSHPRTPQATVVMARLGGGRAEYLVLSDSVLLIEETDGAVRVVADGRLERLRPRARRLPAEERAAFVEGLRNRPGGFFTAAADPEVAGKAVTGSVPLSRVRRLAALSDGVGRWVETFGLGGWPELMAALAQRGPTAVIGEVREREAADGDGRRFPRGKIHDDASAIVVEPWPTPPGRTNRAAVSPS